MYDADNQYMSEKEFETLGKSPSWFKLYPEELINATGIREIESFDQEEINDMLFNFAEATVDALLYFDCKSNNRASPESIGHGSRLYRTLFNIYQRNIDEAFRALKDRIMNGKKGGRPRKET